MKPSVVLGIAFLLLGCASASDDATPHASSCDRLDFGDDRYLCQALTSPDPTVSTLFCEEILEKDRRNYCRGMVKDDSTFCHRVVNAQIKSNCLERWNVFAPPPS